ncbi:hypothetical protein CAUPRSCDRAFT_11553, partial [Caulochytrium protostelioides]
MSPPYTGAGPLRDSRASHAFRLAKKNAQTDGSTPEERQLLESIEAVHTAFMQAEHRGHAALQNPTPDTLDLAVYALDGGLVADPSAAHRLRAPSAAKSKRPGLIARLFAPRLVAPASPAHRDPNNDNRKCYYTCRQDPVWRSNLVIDHEYVMARQVRTLTQAELGMVAPDRVEDPELMTCRVYREKRLVAMTGLVARTQAVLASRSCARQAEAAGQVHALLMAFAHTIATEQPALPWAELVEAYRAYAESIRPYYQEMGQVLIDASSLLTLAHMAFKPLALLGTLVHVMDFKAMPDRAIVDAHDHAVAAIDQLLTLADHMYCVVHGVEDQRPFHVAHDQLASIKSDKTMRLFDGSRGTINDVLRNHILSRADGSGMEAIAHVDLLSPSAMDARGLMPGPAAVLASLRVVPMLLDNEPKRAPPIMDIWELKLYADTLLIRRATEAPRNKLLHESLVLLPIPLCHVHARLEKTSLRLELGATVLVLAPWSRHTKDAARGAETTRFYQALERQQKAVVPALRPAMPVVPILRYGAYGVITPKTEVAIHNVTALQHAAGAPTPAPITPRVTVMTTLGVRFLSETGDVQNGLFQLLSDLSVHTYLPREAAYARDTWTLRHEYTYDAVGNQILSATATFTDGSASRRLEFMQPRDLIELETIIQGLRAYGTALVQDLPSSLLDPANPVSMVPAQITCGAITADGDFEACWDSMQSYLVLQQSMTCNRLLTAALPVFRRAVNDDRGVQLVEETLPEGDHLATLTFATDDAPVVVILAVKPEHRAAWNIMQTSIQAALDRLRTAREAREARDAELEAEAQAQAYAQAQAVAAAQAYAEAEAEAARQNAQAQAQAEAEAAAADAATYAQASLQQQQQQQQQQQHQTGSSEVAQYEADAP